MIKKESSLLSKVLIPGAGILALLSVVSYQAYAEEKELIRFGILFGGLILSLVLVFVSPAGKTVINYFKDSVIEAKRVVWPTRKETFQTVAIVFLFVLFSAIFLWLADKFFEWILYSVVLGWK